MHLRSRPWLLFSGIVRRWLPRPPASRLRSPNRYAAARFSLTVVINESPTHPTDLARLGEPHGAAEPQRSTEMPSLRQSWHGQARTNNPRRHHHVDVVLQHLSVRMAG